MQSSNQKLVITYPDAVDNSSKKNVQLFNKSLVTPNSKYRTIGSGGNKSRLSDSGSDLIRRPSLSKRPLLQPQPKVTVDIANVVQEIELDGRSNGGELLENGFVDYDVD